MGGGDPLTPGGSHGTQGPQGGGTDGDGEGGGDPLLPPTSRSAGPRTPGEDLRTQGMGWGLATPTVAVSEAGGPLSVNPEQLHSRLPPPLRGGGTLSDTAGQQRRGPPASELSMGGRIREEGGTNHPEKRGDMAR